LIGIESEEVRSLIRTDESVIALSQNSINAITPLVCTDFVNFSRDWKRDHFGCLQLHLSKEKISMTQQLNYDATQAGIQMTLSSIAYVDESQSPEQIKFAIETELAKTKYATRGNWELAWGPGNIDGNLMYIAKNKVNTNQYSLVIRGTDWDYISNLKEDFWLQPVKYPYASGASGTPMVSHGVLEGLQKLQQLTDPLTSQTLEEYLKSLATNSSLDLIVTGHSLGGGLASIALIWLYDTIPGWGIDSGKIKLSAYTFAAPTAGNQDFATYFNVTVGNNCFRIVNPLDIVPNAWGDLSLILQEQIPTTLPCYMAFIIAGAIAYLDVKCWFYKQVNTEKMLRKVQIPPSVTYRTQVADQHNSNSYLYLLGAPQTDIGTLSPLPNYDKKEVAQNIFQEIMKDKYYSTVRVSFTTEFASASVGRVCQS
jgi:hypothetical protein